jgi:putative membrane protein
MIVDSPLPAVNAILNGTAAVLIGVGVYLIKTGRPRAHRAAMIAAFTSSCLFLCSYLYYHFAILHGHPTHFPVLGWPRRVYFTILLTHTVLAAVIVPLVLITLTRGLKGRIERHRPIARWTYPLWLYVSITGVVIYMMLYRIYV